MEQLKIFWSVFLGSAHRHVGPDMIEAASCACSKVGSLRVSQVVLDLKQEGIRSDTVACHLIAGLQPLKRAKERLPMKLQPNWSTDPSNLRCQHHRTPTKDRRRCCVIRPICWVSKTSCVCCRRLSQHCGGAQRILSESKNSDSFTLLDFVGFGCFVLETRKYLGYYLCYRGPELRVF